VAAALASFNPLTGIRSLLTSSFICRSITRSNCFNPLTGFRSHLTFYLVMPDGRQIYRFPSSYGDSFFSDETSSGGFDHGVVTMRFQSPHGDSFFSDIANRRCSEAPAARFQSPHGDSFFSDDGQWALRTGTTDPGFQSPHGDSFFSDIRTAFGRYPPPLRFNPLTGIRSFLTEYAPEAMEGDQWLSFNPLTGIRSFLTSESHKSRPRPLLAFQSPHGDSFLSDALQTDRRRQRRSAKFQSPHGDSFLSDNGDIWNKPDAKGIKFQSPHGDSFLSDVVDNENHVEPIEVSVSIPSRGFVPF